MKANAIGIRRPISLRLSLILGIFALVLVTFGMGAAAVYVNAASKVETEMKAAVAVSGQLMKRAVATIGPPYSGREVLDRLVQTFDGDRHVQAVLIGPHGVVLSASTPADPEQPAPQWFQDLIDARVEFRRVELPSAFEGRGALVLQSRPLNEISEVWEDATKLFTTLAMLGVMILTLVYLHVSFSLRPLGRLAGNLEKVGDERSSLLRVPLEGPSELIAVSRGFNDMLDRLERAEAQNRRLNEQLAEVQEEERAELARDLHDEIGPLLFAVDVDAAAIERRASKNDDPELARQMGEIREGIAQLRRSVRELLARLRPAALVDLGLAYAVDNLVAFWRARRPDVTFDVAVTNEDFGEDVNGAVYRIIQESLNNAVRHGRPKTIAVRVAARPGQDIEVTVSDNGTGFDDDVTFGFGIAGMQERAAALGGRLQIGPSPSDNGVRVRATIPRSGIMDRMSQHEAIEAAEL